MKQRPQSSFWTRRSSRQQTGIVLAVLIVLSLIIGIPSVVNGGVSLADIGANLATGLLGTAITFYLLDWLLERTREREQRETQRKQLIRQLGSQANAVALNAAAELRTQGWLVDGSVQGVRLARADLENAELWAADLTEADLRYANLQAAQLWGATLERCLLLHARLAKADLREANLAEADLSAADLTNANLEGANLSGALLDGAILQAANLSGVTGLTDAQLAQTSSLTDAILPDGTRRAAQAARETSAAPPRPAAASGSIWQATTNEKRNAWIVEISGRVDSTTASQLGDMLDEFEASGAQSLAIELASVEYMSSAGLRELVSGLKKLKASSKQLVLVAPSDRVKEVLELAGLDTIFDIYPNMAEALSSL
ncbi:MAG: anti-sigma factor antagonist [Anaerolineae bacterium]|nr:anti-sigma factor antagonist [Anaerolineae bacterium]